MDPITRKRSRNTLISGLTSLICGIVCIAVASIRIQYGLTNTWNIMLLVFGIICVISSIFQLTWVFILCSRSRTDAPQTTTIIVAPNQMPVLDNSGQQQFGIPGVQGIPPNSFANPNAAFPVGYQTNYWQPPGASYPPPQSGAYQMQPFPQQVGAFPPQSGAVLPAAGSSTTQVHNFPPHQDGDNQKQTLPLPNEPPPAYAESKLP